METKSRYEVIADLEKQKRVLIREKDEIDDGTKTKERAIKNLERTKEDIAKQRTDFGIREDNSKQDLDRERANFEFKIKNTEDQVDREIVDATEDLKTYKDSMERKKETSDKLIEGINESLERFGKLQSK